MPPDSSSSTSATLPQTPWRQRLRRIPPLGWVVLIVVVSLLGSLLIDALLGRWFDFEPENIRAWLEPFGWRAPAVYILLMIAAVVISPIPSVPLDIAAGLVFGLFWGTVYTVIGAEIGAIISFAIARRLGRPRMMRWIPPGAMATIDRIAERRGFVTILLMRLLPLFSFDWVSYGAGISSIRFSTFAWATFFGMIPPVVAIVAVGATLPSSPEPLLRCSSSPWSCRSPALASGCGLPDRTRPKEPLMPIRKSWDLVVIGGGTAGMTVATRFASTGRSVALIEADRTGGECLYTGCVPSKALLASAKVAHTIRRAGDFGISADPPAVDFATIMRRKDEIIATIAPHDSPEALSRAGVIVIHGHARFVDGHTLRVGEDLHVGEQIVIATGSAPNIPDIRGLPRSRMVTSDTIFDLDELPRRLAVIGAGPAGLELGQAFARFGAEVTIIARGGRIMAQAEPDHAERLRSRLEAEGIRFSMGTVVTSVETDEGSGQSTLTLDHASGEQMTLDVDCILDATGRCPTIDSLALDNAGVSVKDGELELDDLLRTTVDHIWACGDVAGGHYLTHRAEDQARTLVTNLLGGADRWNDDAIPWAVFTDPPIASIGMSLADAPAAHGNRLEVLRFPYSRLDRAITDGDADGEIMVLLKPGWTRGRAGGEIVGAHIIGERADDLINQFAPMMRWRLPAGLLAGAVQVYPTHALGVRQAVGLHWRQKPRSPKPSLLSRVRRWRRHQSGSQDD